MSKDGGLLTISSTVTGGLKSMKSHAYGSTRRTEPGAVATGSTYKGDKTGRSLPLPVLYCVSRPWRPLLQTASWISLLVIVFIAASPVSAKKRPIDMLGLRIGMTEEAVHKHLRKIATQREEKGEQEVWILKDDNRFDYVLTRFNREHRLNFITVVARTNRVRYSDIAESGGATVATDGRTFAYKWKVQKEGKQQGYLLIARGSNVEFLTSYSLYPTR